MARKRLRLAQRRKAVGLSQESLAEVVGVDRSTVVRWERADTEPQPWHRPKLAQVLRVSIEELSSLLADVVDIRPDVMPDVPEISSVSQWSTVATDAAGADHGRRTLLQAIAAVAAASGLLGGHLPKGSRCLGATDVARLNAVTTLYRSVDYEWGGGLLHTYVAQFAESTSALLSQKYTDALRPDLFAAVAAARQLAGWTAFDSCRYADGQRHFLSAERVALAADNVLLAARIRYCQARQFQHLRHNQDALETLRLAQDQLGQRTTPAVAAMLSGAEGASLAALGDRSAAQAALSAADQAFDQIRSEREPDWMRFYDRGELLAQHGRVYRDFARSDKRHGQAAVHWVREALPAYGAQNVRSTVLSEVSLCSALFLADEPDQALAVGWRTLNRAGHLTSPRIFDRIRNLRRDLTQHRQLPEVAAFARELAAIRPASTL
ncbi:MAG TPA: helix-turn-helix transcriptional regulator [Rugosimonospora sp.]|nr:helix-turn-helix transcriptional regulator [Rugosimonospora sp.]